MRLIDAGELIEMAYRMQLDSREQIARMIESAPTIEPVRKQGKWLNVEHAPNNMWYCTCSVCRERQTVEIANHCPNCGAKNGHGRRAIA